MNIIRNKRYTKDSPEK